MTPLTEVDAPPRQWVLRSGDPGEAAGLEAALGLDPVTARILAARGLGDPEAARTFLDPGLDLLHSPFEFACMEAAVDRVLSAVRRREPIVVHGDYDVDGVTGTVLLVTVLQALGARVGWIVPHRLRDGYGLQPGGIDRAREQGAGLVIAVDCGITSLEAAERARELGIDLVIADHHQPGAELPEAVAILDPCLPDAGYPDEDLAAVGVAFKLARGLLERHERNWQGIALLKLVAIGTVADMVSLTGENRAIARYGLSTLLEVQNPGLRALMQLAGVGSGPVSAGDVAFRIAPRINAAGRLGDAADAVEMFLAADPGRARTLARGLHEINDRRRQVERQVVAAALEQAPGSDDGIVVAAGEGWHRGVVGIVASRLVETYGRPAVVLSVEGDRAHGSARSIPGFSIVGALGEVAPLLTRFGGHHQAAGLELPAGRVEELRRDLAASGGEPLREARGRVTRVACDAELDLEGPVADVARELERLAPFGIGNPRPRLLVRDVAVDGEVQRLKEEHLKVVLRAGDRVVEAVGWRQGERVDTLAGCRTLDLVGTLRMRRWRGRQRPQLEIVDVCAGGTAPVTAAEGGPDA